MARPLRIEFTGALYHVMARGNARAEIYKDDTDRTGFLSILGQCCERFDWMVWAYCLMGNHYHLLVETGRPSLSRGMRELNGQYTQAFNRRHRRAGHLLQGRYKAILVEKEAYLLELSRYIVLNPVQAKLVKQVDRWPWSSYRAVMGQGTAPGWLAVRSTLELFHRQPGFARQEYARFVAEGVGAPDPMLQLRNQLYLGSDSFIEKVAGKTSSKRRSSEVPRLQRVVRTLPAYAKHAKTRDEAIRAAYDSGTYTLSDIGRHFDLHYTTVSRLARKGSRKGNE